MWPGSRETGRTLQHVALNRDNCQWSLGCCPALPWGSAWKGFVAAGLGPGTHRILSVYLVQTARLPSPHTFYLITCHC